MRAPTSKYATLGSAWNLAKNATHHHFDALGGGISDRINDAVSHVGSREAAVIVVGKKHAKALFARLNKTLFEPEPDHNKMLQGYLGQWVYLYHIVSDCYKEQPMMADTAVTVITHSGQATTFTWK